MRARPEDVETASDRKRIFLRAIPKYYPNCEIRPHYFLRLRAIMAA